MFVFVSSVCVRARARASVLVFALISQSLFHNYGFSFLYFVFSLN